MLLTGKPSRNNFESIEVKLTWIKILELWWFFLALERIGWTKFGNFSTINLCSRNSYYKHYQVSLKWRLLEKWNPYQSIC